jgi:hypothetical protein
VCSRAEGMFLELKQGCANISDDEASAMFGYASGMVSYNKRIGALYGKNSV